MLLYLRTRSIFLPVIKEKNKHIALFLRVFTILGFSFFFNFSNAQSRKQLEQKRKKVQADIAYTRTILNKTNQKKTATLHKINTINQIINKQGEVIGQLKEEVAEADSEIVKQAMTLDELKAAYESEKLKLKKIVRQAYKNRKSVNELAFVFSAGTFRQLSRRLKYLKRLSQFRESRIAEVKDRASKVKNGLEKLEEIKSEKTGLLTSEEVEKRQMERDRNEKAKLVKSLAGQEAELRSRIKQNEKQVAQLNANISALIAREIAAARKKAQQQVAKQTPQPSSPKNAEPAKRSAPAITMTPEARSLSNDFAGNRGGLPWPVERGYISQYFGTHAHPDLAGITLVNNGVDITTGEGSTARAVFRGTVSAILDIPGQEKAVLINHGEYFTVYSRLSDVFVSKGQEINAKQALGKVWTDDENKTILQFQVWQGQAKQNPANWIAPR